MYLFFAFMYIYSLYTFAMHCIALLLHMYFAIHYIACPCICTFLCIVLHASAYALSYALHCIPLHMHFPLHCIAFPCICTFTCIACPCILLVSHFTCIKGFLSPLLAQAYKLQVVSHQNLILSSKQTLSFSQANNYSF